MYGRNNGTGKWAVCALLHLTWCLPQTVLGAILYLCVYQHRHTRYRSAVVTEWNRRDGFSLGAFLFVPQDTPQARPALLRHEYGHTVQSLFLGPLYLPLVVLPSLCWAGLPCFQKMRQSRGISYYGVYPENWADRLGDRYRE